MKRPPATYAPTYRNCIVCNDWRDSANPQEMEIGSDGQARCWRHAHRAPRVKGRIAFPKRRKP